MRMVITALILTAVTNSAGVSQQVDRQELRKILKLPRVQIDYGIEFSATRGFVFSHGPSETQAEVEALRKAMKGTSADAERHSRLGPLYAELGDRDQEKEAFTRAVELYRQRAKSRPRDDRILAQLGQALSETGQNDEAEAVLRRAVERSPREAKAWLALGRFLEGQTLRAFLAEKTDEGLTFGPFLARILSKRPTSVQLARAKGLLDEARRSFDTAVAAAPKDPEAYGQRGLFRTWGGLLMRLIPLLQGSEADLVAALKDGPDRLFAEAMSPAALQDFRQVARLRPGDYQAITAAALFEVMSFLSHNGRSVEGPKHGLQAAFPAEIQQSLRGAASRLEKLAQGRGRQAPPAAEALGALQYSFMDEPAAAEKSLRRAVALDSTRDRSWDLLAALMLDTERYPDLATLCEERLRHKDSARGRILLAKAYEKLDDWDRVEEQVRASLKLEPEDFRANLALVVVLLKRGDDASLRRQAELRLLKARDSLPQAPTRGQVSDYTLTLGIYLALDGDREGTLRELERVLTIAPDNKEARTAWELLRESARTAEKA